MKPRDNRRTTETPAGSLFFSEQRLRTFFWAAICSIVFLYVAVSVVETALRMRFPWDLYVWAESPFLTDMIKLDHHLPVFTAPADGNSFVYSPGLEYITYALLKPFGLELDIRFCRLVSVLIGVLAAGCGAMAIRRIARATSTLGRSRLFGFVTWGVVFLVLSKNFTADIPHPDNLQALHALLVFWLCLTALETKRFGLAVATMIVAGVGVFTKQVEVIAFVGPAAAFALLGEWGWKRWLLLAGIGVAVAAISLYLLWLPRYARFYTFDLLAHQGLDLKKISMAVSDLLRRDRGALLILSIPAGWRLWRAQGAARRYLICWVAVGCFSTPLNMAAYLKTSGIWNNLILFELWLILIVWPFVGMLLDGRLTVTTEVSDEKTTDRIPRIPVMAGCALTLVFLGLLVPIKKPPGADDYRYCGAIQAMVNADVQAGRKVLVAHGAEFLLRAGVRDVPRDLANTIYELDRGGVASLSEINTRIEAGYYDRIYLIKGAWYGEETLKNLAKHYHVDSTIPGVAYGRHGPWVFGYQDLMLDCPVLSPNGRSNQGQ